MSARSPLLRKPASAPNPPPLPPGEVIKFYPPPLFFKKEGPNYETYHPNKNKNTGRVALKKSTDVGANMAFAVSSVSNANKK